MTEPIEISFRLLTRVAQGSIIRWSAHRRNLANTIEPSMIGGPAKTAHRSRWRLGCGLGWTQGATYSMGSRSTHAKGLFLGERTCPGMPDDTLPWAVQKWLNRSRCSWGCWLGWAHEHVFT